jgi:hypothetical protein
MGIGGLDDTDLIRGMLFNHKGRLKQARLDTVADQLKDRFGIEALRRGSSLEHGRET